MSNQTQTPPTPPADQPTDDPRPAAYADLKAALPGADAGFLCTQMEANATVAQAQTAWMAEQNSRLEAANKAADDAKGKLAAKESGVPPLGGRQTGDSEPAGDPIAKFDGLVNAKIAAGVKRGKAVSAVIAENPELHEEYLAAYNAARKSK